MAGRSSQDVQRAVDELAGDIGLAVLVEDPRHAPLWWSDQSGVDDTRTRTILRRGLEPGAAALVSRLRLAQALEPVRTPAVAEADMAARWCLPLRADGDLLGYLWVSDPEHRLDEAELGPVRRCAALATAVLAARADDQQGASRHRARLLGRLLAGPDDQAAGELIAGEGLGADAVAGIDIVEVAGAVSAAVGAGGPSWPLVGGRVVRVDPAHRPTSGSPLPLSHLQESARRAEQTRRTLRAGARLAEPTWDQLGSWHLVADAPDTLAPADVHPGVVALGSRHRPDLLQTARVVLEHSGDIAAAALELNLHRTTLYYRLERIEALTGVDLKAGPARTDLQLAIRLTDYRAAGANGGT